MSHLGKKMEYGNRSISAVPSVRDKLQVFQRN